MTGPPPVRFLEHTADVGIELDASTLADLFRTAAAGMFVLLLGESDEVGEVAQPVETRRISLTADDVAGLLVAWLRELCFIHDTTGLAVLDVEFDTLNETRLDASVRFVSAAPPIREIKAVTWHQLAVEHRDHTWYARVIFDV